MENLFDNKNLKIIYSKKRRSVSIEINDKAEIIVRAPSSIRQRDLESILDEKSSWILKKLKLIKSRVENLNYQANENTYLFLGQRHKSLNADEKIDIDWYIKQAEKTLIRRTKDLASIYDLQIKKIRISKALRKWGSCSHDNNIALSWRLIMAPIQVIDYVIIHELAHVIHKNHSKAFWAQVESMMPDYKTWSKWLKTNGYSLQIS